MLMLKLFFLLFYWQSLLKCLVSVVNDNVNNVYLMMSFIYVMLYVVVVFITLALLNCWVSFVAVFSCMSC